MTATILASPTARLHRAVAGSVFSLVAARVAHLVLNVVTTLALIRYLGPAGYGEAIVVLSVAGIFGLVGDFGLLKLGVREVARRPETASTVIGTVVALRLALGLAAGGGAQLTLLALGASSTMRLAMLVLSVSFLCEAVCSVAITFHVSLRQQYEALARVVMEAVELVVLLLLISRSAGLVGLMAAPVVGASVGTALAFVCARRRFGLRLSFAPGTARWLLRESWVVGPAALLGVAYLKVDNVVLAALRPSRDVGIYGAAYQPIEYLVLGTAVLVNVLYPLLARWYSTDHHRFVRLYQRGTDALLAATLPVPILAGFVAPPLVDAVLAPRFGPSAGVLRLLSVALVFMVLHSWQAFVLLAAGEQRAMLRCLSAALVVNAALDVALVAAFGYTGAGIATLATSALVCCWTTGAVARLTGASLARDSLFRLAGAALALTAICALALGAGLSWWLAIMLALAGYALALLRLGVADPAVLRSLTASAATEEVLAP